MSDVNTITNQLLLKYDDSFNKLYNKKLNIDSSIMNKEEIIIKENNEILRKDNIITKLNYSIILLISLIFLIVLYGLNIISNILFIILCSIFLVIFFINYIRINSSNKVFTNSEIRMDKYLEKKTKDYKCPVKCSNKPGQPIVNPNLINGYAQPTLNINPQLNVWKDGDIPESLWTSTKHPANKYYSNQNIPNYYKDSNNPKEIFKRDNKALTYYKCEWLGGNNNGGLPNSDKKYSTIPCTYKPNYSETARYICRRDPNKLQDTNINNYCDKISGESS